MPEKHISTFDLLQIDPSISCADCRKRLTDSPDHEIWSLSKGAYYCPQCANAEGIEATETERQTMEQAQGFESREGTA